MSTAKQRSKATVDILGQYIDKVDDLKSQRDEAPRRPQRTGRGVMADINLTDRERGVLRHALGFSTACANGTAYRNYYNADDGGEDFATWKGMEVRGLAVSWKSALCEDATYFAASGDAARSVRLDRRSSAAHRRRPQRTGAITHA